MRLCSHNFGAFDPGRGCGCDFVRCSVCGVIFKTTRCPYHTAATGGVAGKDYFSRMGCFSPDGIPENASCADEWSAALARLGESLPFEDSVLEIGCGVGRLAPTLLRRGCEYTGIDLSRWAVDYTARAYSVRTYCGSFPDDFPRIDPCDAIISAHTLEHFRDPENALAAMSGIADKIYLLIPDARDPWNPDHWTMFCEDTIEAWGRKLGYDCRVYREARPADIEDYIYAVLER